MSSLFPSLGLFHGKRNFSCGPGRNPAILGEHVTALSCSPETLPSFHRASLRTCCTVFTFRSESPPQQAEAGPISPCCAATPVFVRVSLADGGHAPEPQVSPHGMKEKSKAKQGSAHGDPTVSSHVCTLTFAAIAPHFTASDSPSDNLERAPRWRQQVHLRTTLPGHANSPHSRHFLSKST